MYGGGGGEHKRFLGSLYVNVGSLRIDKGSR